MNPIDTKTVGAIMKIAFIGFGGAASGLTKGLKEAGVQTVLFFDSQWDTPPYGDVMRKNAAETGAVAAKDIQALAGAADMIISCVTGSAAVAVAEESAPFLKPSHLFIDVNTAAPKVMEKVAAIIEKTGAGFADVAMMGAIPAFLHRVPCLASGKGAEKFKALMQPYEMNITCVGEKPGQASAIKMFRSIFMKGFLALLLETLNATHRYQVDDIVLNSIAETMEKSPFLDTVRLQMGKGVINAERMAHEMQEVVQTLKDIDVSSVMSFATQEKLKWCAGLGLKAHFGAEMRAPLDDILDAIEMKLNPNN